MPKNVAVPSDLEVEMRGEALFNDGVPANLAAAYAVVLFSIIAQGSTLGLVARGTLRTDVPRSEIGGNV